MNKPMLFVRNLSTLDHHIPPSFALPKNPSERILYHKSSK